MSGLVLYVRRVWLTLTGRYGVWCKKGARNHISKGAILYEKTQLGHDNYFAPYTLSYNTIIGNYNSIGPGCRLGLSEHDINAISTKPNINNGGGQYEII